MRRVLALAIVVASLPLAAARSADAPLPLLVGVSPPAAMSSGAAAALAPSPLEPESIYHGLVIGSEVFGVSGHGVKGGIGGDVYAGYERVLNNGLLLGIQGATGYGPSLLGRPGLKGFDFGEASARIGYPMGRLTPFLTAGLVVAKPVTGPGLATTTTDGLNDLMNGACNLYAAPHVGAGFAYALTSTTTVLFDVSVGRGVSAGLP